MLYNIFGDFMSTHKYNDLFLKCQDTGKYHVFTFDIKESKKMILPVRQIAQYKLVKLNLLMYQEIEKLEKKENRKILVFEEDCTKFGEARKSVFGVKQEPFLLGDLMGFTVYRGTITRDEVIKIYEKYRKELDIDFEFHLADGYYETNKYEEGSEKYFRGYCIDLLSNLHKDYNNDIRKKLEKKKTC